MGQIVNPLQPGAAIMPVSRRGILEAGRSILTATIGLAGTTILPETTKAAEPPRPDQFSRQVAAFQIRRDVAQAYRDASVLVHISNGDEERYADKRASFAKTLPHNDAGEVDANAFAAFIRALTSGKADGFETIPRDRSAETELNNPQATYAFDLVGLDGAPVAFPEGCPTHPSYPSAHACNSGACATVLKAFFDAEYALLHPVEATADGLNLEPWRGVGLTLGNEIDKLASNIALGRDAARCSLSLRQHPRPVCW